MKFLLLLAFLCAMIWLLRRGARARSCGRRPQIGTSERMVQCGWCGVHQPMSESVQDDGRFYCCPAHRVKAEGREAGHS